MVGYSGLMAADEEGTLASLKTLRKEIIDPTITKFHGRVVKLMGDGTLMEFGSAVDAVNFSVEIQQSISRYNLNIAYGQRITFRIGINIGDVVVEDDDIYGNGVNVAARLEGISDPGGICVSGTVVDHVKGKLDVYFLDRGKQQVKNIPQPVHVFTVSFDDDTVGKDAIETKPETVAGPDQETPSKTPGAAAVDIDLSIPDSPSIAVLPFDNMSADPEQEFFSDGITEDIITALSKIRELLVVARNSTFTYKGQAVDVKRVSREQGVRYVLEGSVRKAGNRVRINVQLIDAVSGHHVWAERYDRMLDDIFAVQDEITKEVTLVLDVHLSSGQQARVRSSGTKCIEAWEQIRLCMDLINHGTPDDRQETQGLCEKALALDPEYAMAWVAQGWIHFDMADVGTSPKENLDRKSLLKLAMECGQKALVLDTSSGDACSLLSLCHLSTGEYDKAVAMSEKAVMLSPSHAEILGISAVVHNKSGQPQKGLELIKKAMRFSPIYPTWFLSILGASYRYTGQMDAAVATVETGIKRGVKFTSGHVNLASIYGELGTPEKASKSVAQILEQDPEFSIKKYVAEVSYKNPQDLERFEEGLRKAGLPE